MTIASEITRIRAAKAALMTAINSKGGTLTASQLLGDYAPAVDAIQTGGGETSFYQCASVDTAAGTWTGYKWEWDDTEGKYILSSSLTSDPLTIEGFTPIVGKTYSGNTRESADMWEGLITEDTEFFLYKSLTDISKNSIPVTNHGLTVSATGIMCTENGYAEIAANALPESVMCDNKDWTIEIKFRCTDLSALDDGSWRVLFGQGVTVPERFDTLIKNSATTIGGFNLTIEAALTDTDWHVWKITHDSNNLFTSFWGGLSISETRTDRNTREQTLYIGWDGYNSDRYGYPFEIEYIKISSAIV